MGLLDEAAASAAAADARQLQLQRESAQLVEDRIGLIDELAKEFAQIAEARGFALKPVLGSPFSGAWIVEIKRSYEWMSAQIAVFPSGEWMPAVREFIWSSMIARYISGSNWTLLAKESLQADTSLEDVTNSFSMAVRFYS